MYSKAPKELIYHCSKMTITGDQEVIIENFRSILEYTDAYVKIQTRQRKIQILGSHLEISYYGNKEMMIQGHIQKIELL